MYQLPVRPWVSSLPETVSLLPVVVVVLEWEAVFVQDLVVLHKEVLRRVDDHSPV